MRMFSPLRTCVSVWRRSLTPSSYRCTTCPVTRVELGGHCGVVMSRRNSGPPLRAYSQRSTVMSLTPVEVIARIPESFDKAQAAGDLLFFPSTIYKHTECDVDFEIRLCPALQQKPQLPTPHFSDESKLPSEKPDPFAPPYTPTLYLGDIKDEEEGLEYVVLFNKYAVVKHHILLVTKEYQSQTSPLRPPDLVQTYRLLIAAHRAGRRFVAFYNCGILSGASQPHKHLQLIPVDDDGPPIESLARKAKIDFPNRAFTLNSLPYANHVRRLPTSLTSAAYDDLERELSTAFLSLLDLVIATVRHDPDYPSGTPSYNFILTLEHMHLIPRKKENHILEETGEALSVNSLGYTGMVLVKSEVELDVVRRAGIGRILRDVGVESVHEILVDEHSREGGTSSTVE
ncbi:ATP adenylyltransferase-domain-containing protein [Fomitopsis betulina]|nr:ATP adenylyltransferase-domain-containing protein [Fomitopsis betulina]